MSLQISGKKMDIGENLKSRIETGIRDGVEKYFSRGFSGQVVMEKQGNAFLTECLIHLDSGVNLQTSAREHDPHASFERALERIEKRLRRYKRKLKNHHGESANAEGAESADAIYRIMSAPRQDEEVAEDFAPAIVAEQSRSVSAESVATAVMHLELTDAPVHVFKNAANGAINIVYWRKDGNIGWIDPLSAADKAS